MRRYGQAQRQQKDRLGAIERLDLALFIDAQDQGLVGRIQIQADDIAHLRNELRVGGELERLTRCGCSPKACQKRLTEV